MTFPSGSGWTSRGATPTRRVGPFALAVLGAAAWPSFRAPSGPPPVVRYAATQLDCASFHEHSQSDLETYVAGHARREVIGIDGAWRFRAATARADSVRLEAWFDTLAVWRRSDQDSLIPDTDGVIGGRFRGTLSPDGRYRAAARPFVPDPVAEVADLSRALDDLLPRLPPTALAVGAVWSDGAGVEIRRLADLPGGDSVQQYRLTIRHETNEASLRGDSLPLTLRQTTREDGTFDWDPRTGLRRRSRRVTVETYVPAEARVARPVRARIEQQVVLDRTPGRCVPEGP